MSLPRQSDFINNHLHICEAPHLFRCTICLSDNANNVARIDHSGRFCYFHKYCIISWFTSTAQTRGTCPNDRIVLFEPTPLNVAQVDSSFGDAVQNAIQVVNSIRNVMEEAETPMEIAFDYQAHDGLRVVALLHARTLESLQGVIPRIVAEELRQVLTDWASEFVHTAPHEIQHDLNVVSRHASFLQYRVSNPLHDEAQQVVEEIVDEHQTLQEAFLSADVHIRGVNAISNHSGLESAEARFPSHLATSLAHELLALFDRTQLLVIRAGFLRAEHSESLPVDHFQRVALDERDTQQIERVLAGLE